MYWIAKKYINGKVHYISGTDQYGFPMHTNDINKVWKFYNFPTAMSFFNLGYAIEKIY